MPSQPFVLVLRLGCCLFVSFASGVSRVERARPGRAGEEPPIPRDALSCAQGAVWLVFLSYGYTLGWSHWAVTPNVVRDVSGRAQRPLGVPLSRIELH